ncbi:MAG: SDR family oxidoreductase [Spirochaetia bacterium]|nr:SDR family oxidoreductase [Spirochaetia bacterium]
MGKITLSGKNVIVTGGSKGIGSEISKVLIKEGANVFIISRDEKAIKALIKEISVEFPNGNISGHSADIGNYNQVKKVVKDIVKKAGSIDGIISNAGMAIPKYFEDTQIVEFESINRVKYLGAVYITKEVYPHLNHNGFISFTSSVVGFMGVFGYSSYVGPNFALIGFAETLMQELTDKNIQISVLCPPDTDTPGYEEEEKTKPIETRLLSGKVKLMSAEEVAIRYIKKLKKGKFIITVNFDSSLFYFLKFMMPQLMIKIMTYMVKGIKKKNKK